MEANQIMALIKQKIGIVILGGVLLAALSFLFLVVTEKNFKANTDFLVIQSQTGTQDYYSLSKSAEYISKILSESIYSEVFVDEVINTGKVNKEFLPFDKKNKLKEWRKIVKTKRGSQLGIISVETFGDSQKDTLNISQGVAEVITTKNNLFIGEGQGTSVKILSGPITEKNPSVEKIILAAIGGFLLGAFISFVLAYYYEERMRNVSHAISKEYEESLKYLDD